MFAKIKKDLPTDVEDFAPTNGEYQIITKIGSGAYGDVYLAQDNDTKWMFAVKDIRKHDGIREIEIFRSIRNKRILRYFGYFAFERGASSEMKLFCEYAPNGDLRSKMKHKLTEKQTAFYIIQILEGVDYLHQADKMHRDLKPENILIDAAENIKICDFGISRNLNVSSIATTFTGTLPYMSPETFNSAYTTKADVWSVGIITIEMITGELPWGKLPLAAFLRNHLNGIKPEYSLPHEATPEIHSFVSSTLQDEELRPTASDLLDCNWVNLWREQLDFSSNVTLYQSQHILALTNKLKKSFTETNETQYILLMLCDVFLETELLGKKQDIIFEHLKEKPESDPQELYNRANALYSNKEYIKSGIIATCSATLSRNPSQPDTNVHNIGSCVWLLKGIVENIETDLKKDSGEIIINIITSLTNMVKNIKCKNKVNEKLFYAYCIYCNGWCQSELKKYETSEKMNRQALKLMSEVEKVEKYAIFGNIYYGLAWSLHQQKKHTEALEYYNKALSAYKSANDFMSDTAKENSIEGAKRNISIIEKL